MKASSLCKRKMYPNESLVQCRRELKAMEMLNMWVNLNQCIVYIAMLLRSVWFKLYLQWKCITNSPKGLRELRELKWSKIFALCRKL